MTITYYPDLVQGSDEWLAQRCGLLTASEMKLIITPKTLKPSSGEAERIHLYELLAQRITEYVEPTYVGYDMVRGREDEILAREQYSAEVAPVTEIGFVTNDEWGFTIGYSPDGGVNDDGLIECKGRVQKYQIQTFIENVPTKTIPAEFVLQCQTGLLVTRRKWLDFISYSGGLPTATIRVYPDRITQDAIVIAASQFEMRVAEKMAIYREATKGMVATERRVVQEMFVGTSEE